MEEDEVRKALFALAEAEGKTPQELMAELLKDKLGDVVGAKHDQLAKRAPGDLAFRGSPESLTDQDYDESPEEAMERWLAEETQMEGGVHSSGGMEGGGIFGVGAVSTPQYDQPGAMRTGVQEGRQVNAQILHVLGALSERLGLPPASPGPKLAGHSPRKALPGKPRRGE